MFIKPPFVFVKLPLKQGSPLVWSSTVKLEVLATSDWWSRSGHKGDLFFYSWWSSMSEEEAQMSGLSHEPWHAMFFLKAGVRRVILDGDEKGCLHQSQGISIWSGVKQTRLPWRKRKKSALQQFLQTLSSSVLSEIIATTFVNFCKGGNKMCQ